MAGFSAAQRLRALEALIRELRDGETYPLLERDSPLNREEWDRLIVWALTIFLNLGGHHVEFFHRLLHLAIDRGIEGCIAMTSSPTQGLPEIRAWFISIETHLKPGQRGGVILEAPKSWDRSWTLIDQMVPIAQLLQDLQLLASLAEDRFPKDAEAQDMYCTRHKNW